MIRTEKGRAIISGDYNSMMADYMVITIGIVDALVRRGRSKYEAWKEIEAVFDVARMTEDELIKAKIVKNIKSLFGIYGEDELDK